MIVGNIIKNILKLFSRKYATNFFACSEVAGRWLFGNKQFNSGKVVIIRNGIELNRFYYNPIKRDELRNKSVEVSAEPVEEKQKRRGRKPKKVEE